MPERASAMRRHRIDADQNVGRGKRGGELVERDFFLCRVDDFGMGGGELAAGGAALQVDPVNVRARERARIGARSASGIERWPAEALAGLA